MTKTISRAILLSCGLAALTLPGCTPSRVLPEGTVTRIDEAGGVARSADGLVELRLGAGALAAPTEIRIETLRSETRPGLASLLYDFGPDGLEFAAPVEVSFRLENATAGHAVALVTDTEVRVLPGSVTGSATGRVTAGLKHFSKYGVFDVGGPCAGVACGEVCTVQTENGQSLTGLCDAEGRCGFMCESRDACTFVAPDCSGGDTTCAGAPCGLPCRLCGPADDGNCVETGEVKHCDGAGHCVPGLPVCSEPATCDAVVGLCPDGTPCTTDAECNGGCVPGTICFDGTICGADGVCGGQPVECAGKRCGDLCAPPCDPATGECPALAYYCDAAGNCGLAYPVCGCDPATGNCPDQCVPGEVCPNGQICDASGSCGGGVCVQGVCPDGTSCISDADCSACTCADGTPCDPATGTCSQECVPGEVCPNGQICDPNGSCGGGVCVQGVCPDGTFCTSDADCAACICADGTPCDPATGTCSQECVPGEVCPNGQICDPNGSCGGGSCIQGACPDGTPCASDADCSACVPGQVCANGQPCNADGTCPSDPAVCVQGACPNGTACQTDADCAPTCADITVAPWYSVELLECGLGQTGVVYCHWTLVFDVDGTLTWAYSDVTESGQWTCAQGVVTGGLGGRAVTGTLDATTAELHWDGVRYAQ